MSVPLRTYYRGLPVSIAITTPAVAIYLCTYRQSKESLHPYLGDTTANYVVASIAAELASSFLWTPLEVVKARLQISTNAKDGKIWNNLSEIARTEGLRGFYRGYLMGLGIFIPYNAVWWSVYENVKKTSWVSGLATPVQAAVASSLAVSASAGLLHPADLVKTRYQVATSGTITALGEVGATAGRASDRDGVRQICRNVLHESGGLRGYYKGFGHRLCCSVPSSLIMMSVFEYLKPDETIKESMMKEEATM